MMLRTLARVALIGALVVLSSAAVAQPAVTILGGPFDLGPSPLGVPSSVLLVTVQNTGTSSLTITGVTASGDFSVVSTPIACQVVVTVAAGGTCTVFVRFTATALGVRNGVVSITDNAPGTPHTFNVTGFGIIAPAYNASPLSLSFDNQALGTTSVAQIVTLTNPGTIQSLPTNGFAITGDFAQTNNCGATIAPLTSCQFNVTFTPTANGLRTGTLTFCFDCNFVTATVNLQGIGGIAQNTPVPTLSQWAIGSLSGILALWAMVRLRRDARNKRY